jgi:hypothetical protein
MKILDKRVLKIGDYEYPQIMVTKDIWEFCDGRPVFPIRFKKDTTELENFAQKFLDIEELKPENIKSDGYHAIENSQNVGGNIV